MTTKIYVGNMNYKVEEVDLGELFEQYGFVNSVKIISDRNTYRSKGFGFVEMENTEEANHAIQVLDKSVWKDRELVVNVARDRVVRSSNRY